MLETDPKRRWHCTKRIWKHSKSLRRKAEERHGCLERWLTFDIDFPVCDEKQAVEAGS